MREPTEAEKAYMAGFIDGEGCIGAYGDLFNAVRVCVANTNVAVINLFKEIYDGCIINQKSRQCASGRYSKPSYFWIARGVALDRLLDDCLPYLIVKRDHALAAQILRGLIVQNMKHSSEGLSPEMYTKRAKCALFLRQLNKKGISESQANEALR